MSETKQYYHRQKVYSLIEKKLRQLDYLGFSNYTSILFSDQTRYIYNICILRKILVFSEIMIVYTILTKDPSKTKIAKFDNAIFRQKNILRFDITMNAIVNVAVVNGL